MVNVSTDVRTTHPLLLDAEGVREAAAAVEAAKAATGELRAERRKAHEAWKAENAKRAAVALKNRSTWSPDPEPNPDLSFEEVRALKASLTAAQVRLDAVVAANVEDVTEGLQIREETAMAEVREHVAALEAISAEFASMRRALGSLASAERRRSPRGGPVSVRDLIYLAGKGENVAVLDFGDTDTRTHWLQVAGAHRG